MTPHELRATLDRLDLSAAEAGHLLGVHRATIYRWLDGSMSVPIVVELLLRLMVWRGIRAAEVTASRHGQTSAKPRSGRLQAKTAKPLSTTIHVPGPPRIITAIVNGTAPAWLTATPDGWGRRVVD